jgi:GR25 family glycosyltransferase involved in LPS biosynthesis
MIKLIISLYYYSTDDLIKCIINNLNSEYICDIYIYVDTVNTLNKLLNTIDRKYFENIRPIRIGKEPLLSEMFLFANDNLQTELCMIAFPGIYLEDCNIDYLNKIQENIYCVDNNAFIFKSPLNFTDNFIKKIEHVQNINGSFENVVNNLFEFGYKIYNPNENIKIKNVNSSHIINYSLNIACQKYLIDDIIINDENIENEQNILNNNKQILTVKLDESIIKHFFCSEYYSMISLEQFILYFLKGNTKIYDFEILDNNADNSETPDICIWEIRHEINQELYSKNIINILISLENLPYWNFHDYRHFIKYKEYENPYMNLYFYNHIGNIVQTNNYLAIPVINLLINHYLLYGDIIKPTEYTKFSDKKFCLIINKSGLNKDINHIKTILENIDIGIVDNISIYDDIILNKSCYHSIELLNIFNKYKFIICYENSYTDSYITEKIFNCFYAKTIPIYNGPPNINNYINNESFITSNMEQDKLIEIISKLNKNEELYNKIINNNKISNLYLNNNHDNNYKNKFDSFISDKFNLNKLVKYSFSKKINLKLVVLHLSKFPERLEKLKEVLNEFKKINIKIEIFNVIIGTDIKVFNTEDRYIKLLKYKNYTRNYDTRARTNRKFMKPGELGCAWSHLNIYEKLINDTEYDNYLVIEDDVVLLKSIEYIKEVLENIPSDFDFCNTNISIWYPFKKDKQVNKYFYTIEKNYFSGMTSYLISKSGARKLLNFAGNNIDIPSDDMVCKLHRYTTNFIFYIPEEPIIYERPDTVSVINKLL